MDHLRKLVTPFVWLLITAISLLSLVYFAVHFGQLSFQEAAMANIFSTVLGVIVGVPIALAINRRQQEHQRLESEAAKSAEQLQRKRKVLGLLRTELEWNLREIRLRRQPIETGGARDVHTGPLKDQLWVAFSDSGELQHVDNPDVLAKTADAYYFIRASMRLEAHFIGLIHYPGMTMSREKRPEQYFLDYLTSTDDEVMHHIDDAIQAISKEL